MKRGDTKERLLRATLTLMSEKGYLGATTREIALAAGVSELTLFRHFGSKERMFEEVIRRYTFLPRLKELLPEIEGLPYRDALTAVVVRWFGTLRERKSLVKIMLSEMTMYPKKIRTIYKKFIDEMIGVLAGYLRSLQEKKVLRPFPPEAGARAIMGMVFSYFNAEELVKGRTVSRKEMERTMSDFVDIFIRGTLAPSTVGRRMTE